MGGGSAHSNKQHTQVFRNITRFVGEVTAKKVVHLLAVFAELRVEGFVVFEEVPLVKEC